MMGFLEYLYSSSILRWLTESLWRDEAFSVLLARRNLFEIVYLAAKDYTPPLYYIILKFWMEVFGSSEVIIRALSMVFYLGSLVMFVIILEKFKIKDKIIYLSTAILATAPGFIYYAFEARPYSLLAFLTLLNFYAFVHQRIKLYFASLVLGFFTHYFFIFGFLSQVFYSYFLENRYWKIFKKIFFTYLFIILMWFVYLIFVRSFIFSSTFWIDRLSLAETFQLFFLIWIGYIKGWESKIKYFGGYSIIFSILFLLAVFRLSKEFFKRIDFTTKKVRLPVSIHKKSVFLVLIHIFVTVFAIVLSLFIKPVFFARYFIFLIPLFVLIFLAAYRKNILIILLSVLFLFNIHYINFLNNNRKRFDWKNTLMEKKYLFEDIDKIFLTDVKEYPIFVYYMPEYKDRIYVVKDYKSLPSYIGKVIYPIVEDPYEIMNSSSRIIFFSSFGKMSVYETR